jgi:tetratricopeptide (TPR) repeat protein
MNRGVTLLALGWSSVGVLKSSCRVLMLKLFRELLSNFLRGDRGDDRPRKAVLQYQTGVRRARKGQHNRAIEKFTSAIELSPDTGALYHHRASSYAELNRHSEAMRDLNSAVRLNPSYPDIYLDRGNSNRALGERTAATRDYSEAVRLRPDFGEAYANRAVVHVELGEDQLAREDAEQALALGIDEETLEELLQHARERAKASANDH